MTSTAIHDCGNGTMLVMDGQTRQRWARDCHTGWRLEAIWPSPQERRGLITRLNKGTNLLVIVAGNGITVDAFP